MGLAAFLILLAGAALAGAVALAVGKTHYPHEGIVAGLATAMGAFFGSALGGAVGAAGPVIEGVVLLPALMGAVFCGGIADLVGRMTTAE